MADKSENLASVRCNCLKHMDNVKNNINNEIFCAAVICSQSLLVQNLLQATNY